LVTAFSPRIGVGQANEIAHKAHNERFGPREAALKLDEPGILEKNFPKMGSPSGVHREARFTPLLFWGVAESRRSGWGASSTAFARARLLITTREGGRPDVRSLCSLTKPRGEIVFRI